MANIRSIIESHQQRMQAAGMLRRPEAAQLSPQVASLRPSLTKINRAVIENPDLLRNPAQPSPFQTLFELIIPKLEPVLVEVGEQRADQMVARLCEYGKLMVEAHGMEKAKEHLYELFNHLPKYENLLKEDNGLETILAVYQGFDSDPIFSRLAPVNLKSIMLGAGAKEAAHILGAIPKYSELLSATVGPERAMQIIKEVLGDLPVLIGNYALADIVEAYHCYYDGDTKSYLDIMAPKISNHKTDKDGIYYEIHLDRNAGDIDLFVLSKISTLESLEARETQVTDAGLAYIKELTRLNELYLGETGITDEGVKQLKGLNLSKLDLGCCAKVTDAGVEHLRSMKNLDELYLHDTGITNEGMRYVGELIDLEKLELGGTKIDDDGVWHLNKLRKLAELSIQDASVSMDAVEKLKKAFPGIVITRVG